MTKITSKKSLVVSLNNNLEIDVIKSVSIGSIEVFRNINNIHDLIKYDEQNKLLSLGRLARENEDKVMALIEGYIVNCNEFFNLAPMSKSLIVQTAQLIVDTYKSMLTVADINLFFKFAKRGDYGAVGARLDGQKILIWLEKYWNDKSGTVADISYSQHLSTKIGCSESDRVLSSRDDARTMCELANEKYKENPNLGILAKISSEEAAERYNEYLKNNEKTEK